MTVYFSIAVSSDECSTYKKIPSHGARGRQGKLSLRPGQRQCVPIHHDESTFRGHSPASLQAKDIGPKPIPPQGCVLLPRNGTGGLVIPLKTIRVSTVVPHYCAGAAFRLVRGLVFSPRHDEPNRGVQSRKSLSTTVAQRGKSRGGGSAEHGFGLASPTHRTTPPSGM